MSSSIQRFEDLNTWQEGMKITSTIYKLFVNCKDFSFRDQILATVKHFL